MLTLASCVLFLVRAPGCLSLRQSYYAHDFDQEEVRVNLLFAEAAAHGVDIRKQYQHHTHRAGITNAP